MSISDDIIMAMEETMAEQNKSNIVRVIVQLMIVVAGLAPLLPMIISGDWGWWQGWAYAVGEHSVVYRQPCACRASPPGPDPGARPLHGGEGYQALG